MTCSVDGCEVPARYKRAALCSAHYQRARRHGDPMAGGTPLGAPRAWLERLLAGPVVAGCVLWPFGRFASGYGGVQIDGRKWIVSRYVCERAHGAPDGGRDAAHACGNRLCVNPAHLYWATRRENLGDMVVHGTKPLGEARGNAKLSDSGAREILWLRDAGLLQKEVARRYGVSRELVGRIWRREAWAWL